MAKGNKSRSDLILVWTSPGKPRKTPEKVVALVPVMEIIRTYSQGYQVCPEEELFSHVRDGGATRVLKMLTTLCHQFQEIALAPAREADKKQATLNRARLAHAEALLKTVTPLAGKEKVPVVAREKGPAVKKRVVRKKPASPQ